MHNTRRFVHAPTTVNGCAVDPGDTILLVLAAANRDPLLAPVVSFEDGIHLCPARSLAPRLAANVLAWTGQRRRPLEVRVTGFGPSANSRIPVFAER